MLDERTLELLEESYYEVEDYEDYEDDTETFLDDTESHDMERAERNW